jgi:two-component system sensor histidine kinase KdpD
VPQEQREQVFEPFQRLGDNANDSGVGLGLAVARGFVRAMGGGLELEDTPGGGLTAIISLPCATRADPVLA